MKKNYLSLRGGKTLHLEYDNGRDDNNSSTFTLLYSMYNLFFKSLSFLIVNAQTYILPKQEKRLYVIMFNLKKSRLSNKSLFNDFSLSEQGDFFLGLLDSLIFLKKSALQILLISKSYMKNYLVTL
ncbi:Uncharacterised protein [Bacteroides faecis]|uniref:Uncharacterized protein n=1 Tax=Bacteroides faecis TaxID=674529 RepID=A0A6N2RA62_9BACE